METETCLMSTPYDPYQAVRLIWHALPISHICKSADLVSFHLDDYIDDVRNTVLESRFRAYPILDENEKVVGTLSRFHLLRPRRKQVILMDHNEKAQSVVGLDQAEILEIVDHHRLADIQTNNPIYVRNEPVGSTTTIVAGMYQEKGLMPTAKWQGLMAAAIVSDTVMFKSPTCTQRDINVANRMARIANLSLEELGKAIFSSTCGDDKSAETILKTDYKEFHIAGHDLAVGQVTCMDSGACWREKAEFLQVMNRIRKEQSLDTVILMITDVLLDGTQLLFTGDEETIQQAFNIKETMETVHFAQDPLPEKTGDSYALRPVGLMRPQTETKSAAGHTGGAFVSCRCPHSPRSGRRASPVRGKVWEERPPNSPEQPWESRGGSQSASRPEYRPEPGTAWPGSDLQRGIAHGLR